MTICAITKESLFQNVTPLPFSVISIFLVSSLATVFTLMIGKLTENYVYKNKSIKVSEIDYRLLFDAIPDPTLICDKHGLILIVNHQIEIMLGFKPEELINRPIENLMPKHYRKGHYKAFAHYVDSPIPRPMGTGRVVKALKKDGSEIDVEISLSPIKTANDTFFACSLRDITERIQAAQEIHKLAYFDSLTNLPNRRYLIEQLNLILSSSEHNKQFGAILFLDLDNFKTLNDLYGHEYGDMLLIQAANRIKSVLRDIDIVVRLGGDEFVVILESLSQSEESAIQKAKELAEKIRIELTKKFQLNNYEYLCSASIGVSIFSGQNNPVSELLKHADIAMYNAKKSGRNAVRVYET